MQPAATVRRILPIQRNILSSFNLLERRTVSRRLVRRIFRKYDADRNGYIEQEELAAFIRDMRALDERMGEKLRCGRRGGAAGRRAGQTVVTGQPELRVEPVVVYQPDQPADAEQAGQPAVAGECIDTALPPVSDQPSETDLTLQPDHTTDIDLPLDRGFAIDLPLDRGLAIDADHAVAPADPEADQGGQLGACTEWIGEAELAQLERLVLDRFDLDHDGRISRKELMLMLDTIIRQEPAEVKVGWCGCCSAPICPGPLRICFAC